MMPPRSTPYRVAIARSTLDGQLADLGAHLEIAGLTNAVGDDVATDRALGEIEKNVRACRFIFAKIAEAKQQAEAETDAAVDWRKHHPASASGSNRRQSSRTGWRA